MRNFITNIKAAHRCDVCGAVRAYGDDGVFDYDPLIRCDRCGDFTRHKYIGPRPFDMHFEEALPGFNGMTFGRIGNVRFEMVGE